MGLDGFFSLRQNAIDFLGVSGGKSPLTPPKKSRQLSPGQAKMNGTAQFYTGRELSTGQIMNQFHNA